MFAIRLSIISALLGLLLVPLTPAPTLLELEMATAIQGELTSTAMPNYMQALDRTTLRRTETDLRTISTALDRYRVDFGDYPVAVPDSSPAGPAPGDSRFDRVFTFANTNSGGPGNLTYPTPYMTALPADPYSERAGRSLPYSYFIDRHTGHWILYSPGPDHDYDIDPLRDFWSSANPAPTAISDRTFTEDDPNDIDGDIVLTNRR